MTTMITFEFTEQMARQIGEILEGGPYRVVAPILIEMQRQISAQQAALAANGKNQESKTEHSIG